MIFIIGVICYFIISGIWMVYEMHRGVHGLNNHIIEKGYYSVDDLLKDISFLFLGWILFIFFIGSYLLDFFKNLDKIKIFKIKRKE